MNITFKRGITGIFIIGFILIPIISVSNYNSIFIVFFTLITFLSLLEFYKLVINSEKAFPMLWFASVLGSLTFLLSSLKVFYNIHNYYVGIVILLGVFLMAFELFRKSKTSIENMAFTFLGLFWIAVPFSLMNFLFTKGLYAGEVFIPLLSVFIFSWANDTGAYLIGMSMGKRKLFERISPKKTWEGLIGGLAFTVLTAYIISLFWDDFSFVIWTIFGLITAVSGIFGDLFESLFKRSLGVKDSGSIMPGHGGFLDRFDCIFFAVPAVLFFLFLIQEFKAL